MADVPSDNHPGVHINRELRDHFSHPDSISAKVERDYYGSGRKAFFFIVPKSSVAEKAERHCFLSNAVPKHLAVSRGKSGGVSARIPGAPYLRLLIQLSHRSLAYSALACLRIGMSRSASFQSVRKRSYALFALALSPDKVYALPSCKCASAPMGSMPTIPR